MAIFDQSEIDSFVSEMNNNELMLITGKSFIGIDEITYKMIINSANAGKKVAYFASDNDRNSIEAFSKYKQIEKPENITIFIPGSILGKSLIDPIITATLIFSSIF